MLMKPSLRRGTIARDGSRGSRSPYPRSRNARPAHIGNGPGRNGRRAAGSHRLGERSEHRRQPDRQTNEQGFYRFLNLPPGGVPAHLRPAGLQDRQPARDPGERPAGRSSFRERRARHDAALGDGRGRGRVIGRRHHLERRRLQLRPRVVENAPLRRNSFFDLVLFGAGLARGRRLQQHPAHHGLRLLLRRELVPGSTASRSRTTTSTRPSRSRTRTRSRRSRSSRSARRRSTAT